jgi:hypothetical protein
VGPWIKNCRLVVAAAPNDFRNTRRFWRVLQTLTPQIDDQITPIRNGVHMATNLPKKTEEDVKRDKLLNRIILVGMGLILLGMIYIVVHYYT